MEVVIMILAAHRVDGVLHVAGLAWRTRPALVVNRSWRKYEYDVANWDSGEAVRHLAGYF